jgi:hypothetical protein
MRASADVKSWSFIPSNEVLSLRWKPSLSDVSYAGLRGPGNGGGARGRGWEGFAGQVMAAPLFAVVDFT